MAKRNRTAAAVIEQPKPEPTPAEKAEAARWSMLAELTGMLHSARNRLGEFRTALETSGPTYAMTWHGEEAMCAELTGAEVWALFQFIVASNKNSVEKLDVLRSMRDRLMRDLVGDGYSGSSGPWHGRSTCPISNVKALTECDAKRAMLKLYDRVIAAFELHLHDFSGTGLYNENFPLAPVAQ